MAKRHLQSSNFFLVLKSDSHLPKIFSYLNEGPFKIMENVVYFILKALFVLEMFTFLSRVFGCVEKRLDNPKIYDVTDCKYLQYTYCPISLEVTVTRQ